MVTVRGRADSALIGSLATLGLSEDAIQVTEQYNRDDIAVDAYGNTNGVNPPDQQIFGAQAFIRMRLVHYDPLVLQECIRISIGGAGALEGELSRAGTLMGGGVALLAAGNNFITVTILSPVGGIPWRFFACELHGNPVVYPLGTKRSVVELNWRAIAYSIDPWNGGTGSLGVPLYDHTAQT